MNLQFKEQDFQIQAVKAVVDCFEGQPLKTKRFTLERSRELIRKAKLAARQSGQILTFETDVLEDIGYRNTLIHNRLFGENYTTHYPPGFLPRNLVKDPSQATSKAQKRA